MEYQQRRLIAAAILGASLLIVIYLVFFASSGTRIDIATPTPTETVGSPATSGSASVPTHPPSRPETAQKQTAEAGNSARDLTPNTAGSSDASSTIAREMAPMPEWMGRMVSAPQNPACPETAKRDVSVHDAGELSSALASAQAGDRITLANGRYSGSFELTASGAQGQRIWICGSPEAILDAGDWSRGIGLRIAGDYAGVWGITITNADQGIVVDGAQDVQVDNVDVHTTGSEAIRFQGAAVDGVVQDSQIHHTGLRSENQGNGITIGSAVADWPRISGGKADQSDRVHLTRNRIWDTSAESVLVHAGSSNGAIEFGSYDGAGMTGAASWVDIRGNGFIIRNNVGVTTPEDGFQTHVVAGVDSGSNNQFIANTAQADSSGYGFFIQDPDITNNVVSCSNFVTRAESGFANIPCVDQSGS